MTMDVSFVIVNYGTMHLIAELIRSIRSYTQAAYEVIVVDNGGNDGRNHLPLDPDVILIPSGRNIGFGAANNLGAKRARGRYLFFLNPDTLLLGDAASSFLHFMDDPDNALVGCCGGDLVTANMEKQVCCGNFPSLRGVIAELGFYRLFPHLHRQQLALGVRSEGGSPVAVDYLSGADLFVRRALFERLGGFDTDFFLYFEETEFAFRIRKAGFQSVLIPHIRIIHLEGASQTNSLMVNLKKARFFEAGRLLFFRKTRGRGVALVAKSLLATQALARALVHWHRDYLKLFRIIANS